MEEKNKSDRLILYTGMRRCGRISLSEQLKNEPELQKALHKHFWPASIKDIVIDETEGFFTE